MTEKFVVKSEDAGNRLDVFLLENMQEFSRSHIKNLIEMGLVRVNG